MLRLIWNGRKHNIMATGPISEESEVASSQRLFELTTLYEVSRLLQGSPAQDQMTFDVLTAVMGLTGARWGVIWLIDENNNLHPFQGCGFDISNSHPSRLSESCIQILTDRSGPLLLNNGFSSAKVSSDHHEDALMPAWLLEKDPELLVPLVAGGNLCGLITLGPNFLDRIYEPFLLNLLGSVGYLVAMAFGKLSTVPLMEEPGSSETINSYRQKHPALQEIVGESQAVLGLFKHLSTVSNASCTVLLEGDTGTGKQLTAEVLHKMGPRREGPFIEMDCGAIPETLIESELFGHKKGAFTGADYDRKGVFELADGGTLFLDEVSNLPPSAQSRLLHVLQERRFRPIGSAANIEVDVRVIAASNRDLHKAVQEGTFREDLFYRLYVYPVRIPSLCERKEDIPILASLFLRQCAEENNLPLPELADGFTEHLKLYDFPGNIRELRHIMERVLLQSEGRKVINAGALDDAFSQRNKLSESVLPDREAAAAETLSTGDEHATRSVQGVYSRGSWVMEILKNHRFNIRAAADNLSSLAVSRLYDVPPLTDRSSLTYYLQGECFRLFLQEDGDIDRVGRIICPDDDELRRIAVMRVQGYIDTARETVRGCGGDSEAREELSRKFSKLPGIYRNVLTRLAIFLRQEY